MATRPALLLLVAACAVLSLAVPGSCQGPVYPFKLPTLGYTFNATEPYIDNATMTIHYTKHHGAYVANLNLALANCTTAQNLTIYELFSHVLNASMVCPSAAAAVRNHGGGHYNHAMYWKTLAPFEQANMTKPSDALQNKINKLFNSTAGLGAALYTAGMQRFGSGFAWVGIRPNGKMIVYSLPNQDNSLMPRAVVGIELARTIPILGVDVWEHAYYLKWQNLRGSYINNWWKLVNWETVNKNFNLALKGKHNDDIWA